MPPLREIVIHIVVELRDMGAAHGATELMKPLYLIDMESYRARREALSGLNWKFRRYAPYASEAASAMKPGVGVSCPFCLQMFEEGIGSLGKDGEKKTRDLLEILDESLSKTAAN